MGRSCSVRRDRVTVLGVFSATTRDADPPAEPGPSRRPATRAIVRPSTASTAPTSVGDIQPQPAAIAAPPSHAPPAFARLKAEWLDAEASVGASFAFCMTSIWSGVVVRKPTAPSTTTVTSAAHCTCAVKRNATSTTASVASDTYSVGRSARSVSGPAASAPSVMPMPNSASTTVTDDSPKPMTSVVIEARYEYTAKTPAKPKTAVASPSST